jgi:endonuclease III
MAQTPLQKVVSALRKRYGAPKAPVAGRDPLALVFWEAVGYLGTDDSRLAAFTALQEQVGLSPDAILGAPLAKLEAICRIGGVFADLRAKRLRTSAALVRDEFEGDLSVVLGWDYRKARRALQRFPMIGESGADRILLLCGSHDVLGLESNAIRTLNRLGYGTESKNYDRTYRAAREAAEAELPATNAERCAASLLLRLHGKETCKLSAPRCEECPVTADCRWFRTNAH